MGEDVFLFYSDQHLRERGSFPLYNSLENNGLTKELNNIVRGFSFVGDVIRQVKPKLVGALGDLFQNTEYQSARVLHAAHPALSAVRRACAEVGCKHVVIPGNHDILNEHSMITSINPLRHYFDEIFLEPSYIDVNGVRLAFIPATSHNGRAYAQLGDACANSDVVCTHMDFAGCRYESGTPSLSGLLPDWDKTIISGDIHLPQSVGSVHYVGSLVQQKFYKYSMDNIGGVLLYYPNTGEIKRIPNTYSKHYIKVRDVEEGLKLDPKKVVLQIVSDKPKAEINEIFKDFEHMYVPSLTVPDGEGDIVSYDKFSFDDPSKLLLGYVRREKPEALSMYNAVMGSKKEIVQQ